MAIISSLLAGLTNWIASGLTAIGIGARVAQIGAQLLVGAGLATAANALAPRPPRLRMPNVEHQSVLNQSTGSRLRGYGRAKLGGTRAFYDSKDGRLYQIIAVHHGQIDAFERFFVGDVAVELTDMDDLGFVGLDQFVADTNSFVQLRWQQGTADQTAYGGMTAAWPGVWTANHRLRGVATVIAIFRSPAAQRFSRVYPEGHATQIRAEARLSRVFDPRNGTTAWSDNPSLCIRDYLVHPDGMPGVTAADVDDASFAAFASVCGQSVTLDVGGTEPRYRLWGLYSLQDDPKDVLARMCRTCDGELYETAEGKIAIRGGRWEAPTVTIEDKNILGFEMEEGAGKFAEFNQLKIVYTDRSQDYQPTEAVSWRNLADQAQRGVIEDEFTADMCPSPTQARRLAKIHERNRNPRWKGVIRTDLVGLLARGERTIRVVIPELGIDDTFKVLSHGIRTDLTGCEIGISSLDASAYAWDTSDDGANPPPPVDTRPSLDLEVPTGLLPIIEARQITSATVAPVIIATVNPPEREDLTLGAEMRLALDGPWEAMSTVPDEMQAVSGVVIDGETYEVRARFVASSGVTSEWSEIEEIVVVANPVAPASPSGLASNLAGSDVELSWVNPAMNFFQSRVFRSDADSFGGAIAIELVAGLPGQPSGYTDTPGSGTWYYWVVALNESNIASAPAGSVSETVA